MEYPRIITLENSKLMGFLKEKEAMVLDGRSKTDEIEVLEKEMAEIDNQIKDIEKSIDSKDLDEEAKLVTEEMNLAIQKMESIKKRVYDRMKEKVPVELVEKFDKLKQAKEDLENARNKVGLKIQKWNDKIIPLARKLLKPFLQDEFEDYESLQIEDGKVIGKIFSHLEDFKGRFKKK